MPSRPFRNEEIDVARYVSVILVAAVVALGTNTAFAHDTFRIIGTVVKYENSLLTMKSREGNVLGIHLDKQTVINRDKKKVPASELKPGLSIVVDAYGDTEDDSLALEIRIVPPIAAR
jgi:hypothetical protein